MNAIDAKLIAVDAETGAFCPGFGTDLRVDLTAGPCATPDPHHVPTSPPIVAGTTVVVGGRVADNVQEGVQDGAVTAAAGSGPFRDDVAIAYAATRNGLTTARAGLAGRTGTPLACL